MDIRASYRKVGSQHYSPLNHTKDTSQALTSPKSYDNCSTTITLEHQCHHSINITSSTTLSSRQALQPPSHQPSSPETHTPTHSPHSPFPHPIPVKTNSPSKQTPLKSHSFLSSSPPPFHYPISSPSRIDNLSNKLHPRTRTDVIRHIIHLPEQLREAMPPIARYAPGLSAIIPSQHKSFICICSSRRGIERGRKDECRWR